MGFIVPALALLKVNRGVPDKKTVSFASTPFKLGTPITLAKEVPS